MLTKHNDNNILSHMNARARQTYSGEKRRRVQKIGGFSGHRDPCDKGHNLQDTDRDVEKCLRARHERMVSGK